MFTWVQASSRIQRWALTLGAYNYSINYQPGTVMSHADALSRLPLRDSPTNVPTPGDLTLLINHLSTNCVTAATIKMWTDKDPLSVIQDPYLNSARLEY